MTDADHTQPKMVPYNYNNSTSCLERLGAVEVSTNFIAVTALLIFVNFTVIAGNVLVVVAVARYRQLRRPTPNVIITSLAIADVLLGIAIMPFSIVQEQTSLWVFGDTYCQLWLALDVWLCTSSIYNLVAVSVDRYLAITRPLAYRIRFTKRIKHFIIPLAWSLSFVVSSPPLIMWLTTSPQDRRTVITNDCSCIPLNNTPAYIVFSSSSSFFFPAILLIIVNVIVYRRVRLASTSALSVQGRNNKLSRTMRVHRKKPSTDNEPLSQAEHRRSTSTHVTPDRTRLSRPLIDPDEAQSRSASKDRRRSSYNASSGSFEGLLDDPNIVLKDLTARNSDDRSGIQEVLDLDLLRNKRASGLSDARSSIWSNRRNSPKSAQTRGFDQLFKSMGRLLDVRVKRINVESKAARTISIVVLCFIICWLPFSVVYLLGAFPFCTDGNCVSPLSFAIVFWLGYCNSMVNPILYGLYSAEFRRAFRKLLTGCCKKSNSRYTTEIDYSVTNNCNSRLLSRQSSTNLLQTRRSQPNRTKRSTGILPYPV